MFAYEASKKYKKAPEDKKREMVVSLGSNFSLDGKKVAVQLNNTYLVLSKRRELEKRINGRLELKKYADVWVKRPDLVPSNLTWLAG